MGQLPSRLPFSNLFISFLFLLLFPSYSIMAQSDPFFFKEWIEIGGTSPSTNFINHLCSTTDGSGKTYTGVSVLNGSDTRSTQITVRLSSGTVSWTQTFTLDSSGDTYSGDITVDGSGNVYITGTAWNGSTNNYDMYLRKYNSSGTYQWQQTFNGSGSFYDGGAAVTCSSSGDIYVAGGTMQSLTDMDLLVRKYNSSGTIQWSKTWDNADLLDAGTGLLISDGGITVTGVTQKTSTVWEYATVQYKPSDGTELNSTVTNLGGTSIERVTAGVQDASGNYYLTGAMGASGQGLNIKTIKFDSDLDIVWTATYNGAANQDDCGRGLAVDGSGNVYVTGYTKSGDKQAILLKYNSSGQQQWSKILDPEDGDDELAAVDFTSDNQIFAAGYQSRKGNRDIYAGMFNPSDGDVLWSELHNGEKNQHDELANIIPDGSGNFTVSGWTDGTTPGGGKVIHIKYKRHTLIQLADELVNSPFIENRGQVLNTEGDPESSIRFYTRSMYPNTYLTDSRVSYVFCHLDTIPASDDTLTRIDLTFTNGNSRPPLAAGLEEQSWHHNYYHPHIAPGRERVPLNNKVLYADIYENIDAIFGQGPDGLFIRLICKPGSDPSDIILNFDGQTALSVLGNGNLKAETLLEDLILKAPSAKFIAANGTETNAGWTPTFSVGSGGNVTITTSTVPDGSTLVIKTGGGREEEEFDETWWSTYYGHTHNDIQNSITYSISGAHLFSTGMSSSVMFPVNQFEQSAQGSADITINGFQNNGTPIWFTMFGGTSSDGSDQREKGFDISTNDENYLYVGGRAEGDWISSMLPNPNGGYHDSEPIDFQRGIVMRMSQFSGAIAWATLFGAPSSLFESITAVKAKPDGGVIVAGYSTLTTNDFPIVASGDQHSQETGDMYIGEFDASDNLIWSTRFGPRSPNNLNDANIPNDIDRDENGNIVVVGYARYDNGTSTDYFPTSNGGDVFEHTLNSNNDGFIVKFDDARELIWSTYFGGSEFDVASGVQCDDDGDIFVYGYTKSDRESDGFPIKFFEGVAIDDELGGLSDLYIAKFNSDGEQIFTRYFGGENEDKSSTVTHPDFSNVFFGSGANNTGPGGGGLALADDGSIFITGLTKGGLPTDWHTSNEPEFFFDVHSGGIWDAFITTFGSELSVRDCMYFGGSSADAGHDIDVFINQEEYEVIMAGHTSTTSVNYPTSKMVPTSYFNEVFQGGKVDGVITEIFIPLFSLSIFEPSQIAPLKVYPNPTSTYVLVENPLLGEDGLVELINAEGKILYNKTVSKETAQLQLDLSKQPSGLYNLRWINHQTVYTTRLFKSSKGY